MVKLKKILWFSWGIVIPTLNSYESLEVVANIQTLSREEDIFSLEGKEFGVKQIAKEKSNENQGYTK